MEVGLIADLIKRYWVNGSWQDLATHSTTLLGLSAGSFRCPWQQRGAKPEAALHAPMANVRDLINAHLYPVLATFAVIYGAIQLAPIANQARYFDHCVDAVIRQAQGSTLSFAEKRAQGVRICNGGSL